MSDRKLLLIFSAMAVVLIGAAATLYFLGAHVLEASSIIAKDRAVVATLNDTLSSLKDAETGQRGYVITGREQYLQPYDAALPKLKNDFLRLDDHVAAGELRKEDIDELHKISDAKLAELAATIQIRNHQGILPTTEYIGGDVGFTLMNRARTLIGVLVAEEDLNLEGSREAADRLTRLRTAGFFACTAIELAFLVWMGAYVGRELNTRRAQTLAIEYQRELHETTLGSIGDAVITTDAAGKIMLMNAVAEQMTGYTQAEAVGRPLPDVFKIINESTRLPVQNPVEKVLETGGIVGLANHTLLIRKDKSEVSIDDSGAPIRNRDGSIRGVVLVFRDFTSQKSAEATIRRSEERLRLAVDAAELGTFYCDVPLDKIVFNETGKRYFFLPPDTDVDFKIAYDRLHPDDREPNTRAVNRAMDDRTVYDIEYRTVSPQGQLRWIRAIGRFYYNADGTPQRLDGVIIDITDRKQAMQRLQAAQTEAEQASRAKDQFLAALSHELRTPLTPVLATLDLWTQSPAAPPTFAEDAKMLRRNVELEARLIDDMLDLTRVVRGKLNLSLQSVDVHELIGQVMNICHEDSAARQVAIDTQLVAASFKVRGDPARLQQVLWNVLRNAIKFSPVGGRIRLSTANDAAGNLRVAIADQGIGMTPQTIDRLFRPFEQGGDDITRRFGGLGLGLAISKALIDLQGGSISATSEGPDKGSTFTVTVPTETNPTAPAAAPKPAVEAPAARRLRILLAEDHADTARILKLIMIGWGNTVETADTIAGAMTIARSQAFDLLISDIGLPDGTGLDLIREFRTFSQIPAIALSGYGMDDDVAQCMAAGFNAHLTKPTDLPALQRAIAKLTSGA